MPWNAEACRLRAAELSWLNASDRTSSKRTPCSLYFALSSLPHLWFPAPSHLPPLGLADSRFIVQGPRRAPGPPHLQVRHQAGQPHLLHELPVGEGPPVALHHLLVGTFTPIVPPTPSPFSVALTIAWPGRGCPRSLWYPQCVARGVRLSSPSFLPPFSALLLLSLL